MLYADKQALRSETAVQVIRVREKEMAFYVQNLNTVSTQATLLAGFTFTFLSNLEFVFPAEAYLSADAQRAIGLNDVNESDGGVGTWDWQTWYTQVFQVLFVIVSYSCLFINLWCTHQCVVNGILGPGLALRGPAGSVDRAVNTIARQCGLVFQLFELGVLLFGISLMLYGLVFFGVVAWLPATVISVLLVRATYKSIQNVITLLWLDEKDAVTGSFLKETTHKMESDTDNRRPHFDYGMGLAKIGQMMSKSARRAKRRGKKSRKAAYRATRRAWLQVRNKKQTPSEASESVGTSRSDRLTNVAADDEADFLILGQQEAAVLKLQRNIRGTLVRMRTTAATRQSTLDDDRQSAAIKMQSIARGLQTRERVGTRLHRGVDNAAEYTKHVFSTLSHSFTRHPATPKAGSSSSVGSGSGRHRGRTGNSCDLSLSQAEAARLAQMTSLIAAEATEQRASAVELPKGRPPPAGHFAGRGTAAQMKANSEDCVSAFALCLNKALFPTVHEEAAPTGPSRPLKSRPQLSDIGKQPEASITRPGQAIADAFAEAQHARAEAQHARTEAQQARAEAQQARADARAAKGAAKGAEHRANAPATIIEMAPAHPHSCSHECHFPSSHPMNGHAPPAPAAAPTEGPYRPFKQRRAPASLTPAPAAASAASAAAASAATTQSKETDADSRSKFVSFTDDNMSGRRPTRQAVSEDRTNIRTSVLGAFLHQIPL